MKILHMISKNDRYGAQRIFLDQVAVLRQSGHDVWVACRGSEGFVTESVRRLGVPYLDNPMKGVRSILSLRQFIRTNTIDIVHTTLDRADHVGLIAARLSGRPVVSTNMVPRAHIGFRFDDRVIILAEKQRSVLTSAGVSPGKIVLVRPGIDVDRFSRPDPARVAAWRQRLEADRFSVVFCHISSMLERKAHEVSIRIAAACRDRGEEPLLVIIGDPLGGPYHTSLLSTIDKLGMNGHVHFTGWTADVPEILACSHFTVLPSENEALGVVLMEGMAAGTPIIAREGEGGAELVSEYGSGFLYRPAEGVAGLADRLVSLKRDSVRFQELSSRCRRTAVEDFSMKRFGERLTHVYEGLTAHGR